MHIKKDCTDVKCCPHSLGEIVDTLKMIDPDKRLKKKITVCRTINCIYSETSVQLITFAHFAIWEILNKYFCTQLCMAW